MYKVQVECHFSIYVELKATIWCLKFKSYDFNNNFKEYDDLSFHYACAFFVSLWSGKATQDCFWLRLKSPLHKQALYTWYVSRIHARATGLSLQLTFCNGNILWSQNVMPESCATWALTSIPWVISNSVCKMFYAFSFILILSFCLENLQLFCKICIFQLC